MTSGAPIWLQPSHEGCRHSAGQEILPHDFDMTLSRASQVSVAQHTIHDTVADEYEEGWTVRPTARSEDVAGTLSVYIGGQSDVGLMKESCKPSWCAGERSTLVSNQDSCDIGAQRGLVLTFMAMVSIVTAGQLVILMNNFKLSVVWSLMVTRALRSLNVLLWSRIMVIVLNVEIYYFLDRHAIISQLVVTKSEILVWFLLIEWLLTIVFDS